MYLGITGSTSREVRIESSANHIERPLRVVPMETWSLGLCTPVMRSRLPAKRECDLG